MKPLALLLLIATACAQLNNGHLHSVMQPIFGPNNATNPSGSGGSTATPAPAPLPNALNTPSTGNRGENRVGSTIAPPTLSDAINDTSCTTEKDEVGECVPYYLCDDDASTRTHPSNVHDIRLREVLRPCPSYLETCCLSAVQRPPTTDPITSPPALQPIREGCGWRNANGIGFRITDGTDSEAKFGEFPWVVAILKIEQVKASDPEGQKMTVYVGGGSLIHPSIVLTAAHYVAALKQLKIRAGEWDTQTTKEIYPYQERDVAHVDIHKDFNKGNLFYDIALLFLATPVDIAPNVGVVCLPPPGDRVQGGTRCFTSGWGKDKFGKEGRYQAILNKVEVPVVERNTCQESLRKTRLGPLFELHSSFMCAGGEPGAGGDACKGDSGSPLVCPVEFEKDRYMQSGIVAWGISCGEDGTPSVYVDVANLRNWVDDKVKGRGFQITGYSYV